MCIRICIIGDKNSPEIAQKILKIICYKNIVQQQAIITSLNELL